MLLRPFRLPEVVWVGAGAVLLCALPPHPAPPRRQGHCGRPRRLSLPHRHDASIGTCQGSWRLRLDGQHRRRTCQRLFSADSSRSSTLVGTIVTIFMSNDATAVVLTPAVLTAVKRAKAQPMPYLLACALSRTPPASCSPSPIPPTSSSFTPAMPPLTHWLAMFMLPSIASIVITYMLLRWLSPQRLDGRLQRLDVRCSARPAVGHTCLSESSVTAVCPHCRFCTRSSISACPHASPRSRVAIIATIQSRSNPIRLVREISWSVLPLVAALFVIVEAVKTVGAAQMLRDAFERMMRTPAPGGGILGRNRRGLRNRSLQ